MPESRSEASGSRPQSDGAGDERPALLGQQPEHPLFRRHQRIQPCRFAVEVFGDGALLRERRERVASLIEVGVGLSSILDARVVCLIAGNVETALEYKASHGGIRNSKAP